MRVRGPDGGAVPALSGQGCARHGDQGQGARARSPVIGGLLPKERGRTPASLSRLRAGRKPCSLPRERVSPERGVSECCGVSFCGDFFGKVWKKKRPFSVLF